MSAKILDILENLIPRSVTSLRSYSLRTLYLDLIAGLTVGLVALPLAMAFAISSGVQPQAGIYCAVVAGFIISALGGSRTQIGGPTGAFVVVVSGIIATHGIDGLFMCTMMAGVILVVLGITGLGLAVKYIPRPVVIGFTNGIAVLIASTQIKDFFGLKIENVPGDFIGRIQSYGTYWHTASILTTALSVSSLIVLIVTIRNFKSVPGAIVALVFGTLVAWLFALPVETIGSRFGGIPSGLPHFQVPKFRADLFLELISPAMTVAMLGAIESLLSAVVADRMSNDKHNPNTELFAQGVANIITPLVGGLPATGAIARTATNIRSGAQTPVAGMTHAITLLLILLFAAPLVTPAPLGVLSAILFVVAYNMGEWHEIPEILKLARGDKVIWLLTFVLTVFADLTVAVEVGMILAALTYIRKVTSTTTVAEITPEYVQSGYPHSLQTNPLPEEVKAFRIHGPFLFGATDKLSVIHEQFPSLPKVTLLRLRNMTAIDATGLKALEDLAKKLKAVGKHLVICGVREQPATIIEKAEFHEIIGAENIQETLEGAIRRAKELIKE